MGADDWKALVAEYSAIVETELGRPFPQDVHEQLWGAIAAVFDSWDSDRAKVYRRLNDIPGDWGTAVNVQAMVFGNMGDTSATGVAFTRDPATGEKAYYGEWLVNAQGEDVVAGIRTPQYLTLKAREAAGAKPLSMEEAMPDAYGELAHVFELLEQHYRDMQDIEFTVERGKLWMLQTRSGKRTAKAALKMAVDMVGEGLIDEKTAILRVDPMALDQLLHPTLDPEAPRDVLTSGLPASPGAASGAIVLDADTAGKPGGTGRSGDPGARRDQPRGHSRHARGQGHPDRARRHDQPRGGGRARHGPAVRFGCFGRHDRHARSHAGDRRTDAERRRYHHARRFDRRSDGGRSPDHRARTGRRFRRADGMGRQAPADAGAHQCRNAARLQHGAAIRRRRHRPVPDRAHVLR